MLDNTSIFKFKKGDKGTFISYDIFGKVIIGKNCKSPGFYKIQLIKELKNCYLVNVVEKVTYDYYDEMPYDEFKKLLISRGYKIAFEMPFKAEHPEDSATDEMRIVAYSNELNMIIVADTFSLFNSFNSIKCYCYGLNAFDCTRDRLLSQGSAFCAVYDLVHPFNKPLHYVESVAFKGCNAIKRLSDLPSGFTYADDPQNEYDFEYYREKFLSLCPMELKEWFIDFEEGLSELAQY